MGTHFRFSNFFFRKSRCLCYNVGKIWYSQTGQRWQCSIVHAHCMVDEYGYRHTLGICNTYCFLTSTVVTRTHRSVPLYLHCPSGRYMVISTVIYFVVARMVYWQHILGFFYIILIMFIIHIFRLFDEAFNVSLYAAHNEVMVWIGMNRCEGRRHEPDVSVLPGICCENLRQNK
jgi:hypothetical protein